MSDHDEEVDLSGIVKATSKKAILIDFDDGEEWVPKSQILDCDKEVEGLERGDAVRVTIPGWLSDERGLM